MSLRKKLYTDTKQCKANEDLLFYKEGITILVAYEFNVFNLGEEDIEIQFNDEGEILVLEPQEGFSTSQQINHARVLTEGAIVKYTYWM